MDRLALRLLEDYPKTGFAKILAERLASRFAENGDRDSFDVVAPKLSNFALAKGGIQLASSLGKAGDSKTALEYLELARNAIDSKKIPNSEIGPLRSRLRANLVKLGHEEALKEIETSADKQLAFQTYLEILYLY